MINSFEKEIELKLLKYVSEKVKINLMTEMNSIIEDINISCLNHSSLTAFIQKQFLQSNLMFRYKLLNSRNGIKIVGLQKGCDVSEKDMEMFQDFASVSKEETIHIINQFDDVKHKVSTVEIALVYNLIVKDSKINHFECLNDELINKVYESSNYFESQAHVESIFNDIKQYGYCFKRNDQYYWKMYTTTPINEYETSRFFTVNEQPAEEQQPEDKPQVVQELTAQDALNFLAKELGFASVENTRSKLDEVLAITNELIDNFNSMQDWEKLMNWNNFVNDWKTIMGDALNDNN